MSKKFVGIKAVRVEESDPSHWKWNQNGQRECISNFATYLNVIREGSGTAEQLSADLGGVWFRSGDWIVFANP